jgi:hypothetical protein
MAIVLAINEILSVRAWSTDSEQAAVNTYNFSVVAVTGGTVTDQDVANSMDTFFGQFYPAYQPTSVRYAGVQVYFLARAAGLPLPAPVKSIAFASAGQLGTVSVPRNARAVMKYATFKRGPSGRGRVYLPFAAVDNLTVLGLPNAAFNSLVNTTFAALLPPFVITVGAATATLVWSLAHRGLGPTHPISADAIISAESAEKFGQMHKSGDYGRANQSPI